MVIGGHPLIMFAAGFVAPFGMDELAIAGGLLGEPVRLVKCKTVDIEVPADAELVLEGEIFPTRSRPRGRLVKSPAPIPRSALRQCSASRRSPGEKSRCFMR